MSEIQKQWDIGVTSLGTVARLQELIRAASQDDVQGQAIICILCLGSGLTIADSLIGTAVDALGGKDNIRLENLKITIGLSSGGTAATFRRSTPGVAIFLLICALKLWQNNEEVGDTLYEMAVASGVISKFPASAYQFGNVVDVLSGYATKILPVDKLNEVGSRILSKSPNRYLPNGIYQPLSSRKLAEVLTRVFAGLKDSEVRRISLRGGQSGMWLAATFLSLLPGDVCISVENERVLGNPGCKLSIDLVSLFPDEEHWRYCEWKSERSFESFIMLGKEGIRTSTIKAEPAIRGSLIPWPNVNLFFRIMLNLPPNAITLIGVLATAILRIVVEEGGIRPSAGPNIRRTPLLKVSSDYFCSQYTSILLEFGWSEEELSISQMSLFAAVKRPENPESQVKALRDALLDCIANSHSQVRRVQDCLDLAFLLSVEALGRLAYIPHNKGSCENEEVYTPMVNFATYQDRISIVEELLSQKGMPFERFRIEMYKIVLSIGTEKLVGDELLLERGGIVLCPQLLLEPSCKQNCSIAFKVIPGSIRREELRYTAVRDGAIKTVIQIQNHAENPTHRVALQAFDGHTYVGLTPPKSIWLREDFALELVFAVKGRSIIVKQLMIFSNTGDRNTEDDPMYADLVITGGYGARHEEREFSWVAIMMNLACAIHLRKTDQLTPRAEEAMAVRLFEDGLLHEVYWTDPTGERHWLGEDTFGGPKPLQGQISCTLGDPLLQLFQLAQRSDDIYVVKHEANLVKAIAIANEAVRDQVRCVWVMVT